MTPNKPAEAKEELKPCAHCGGKAQFANDVGQDDDWYSEWIECCSCGVRTAGGKFRELIQMWNHRPTPPQPSAEQGERVKFIGSVEIVEAVSKFIKGLEVIFDEIGAIAEVGRLLSLRDKTSPTAHEVLRETVEALEKQGQHLYFCDILRPMPNSICTCGLEKTLTRAKAFLEGETHG